MPVYFGLNLTGWLLIILGTVITIAADVYVNSAYRKYKRKK